jgi:anhydro-N-acetylmuramic acid kinase
MSMRIIGLMSGTSADGIDACLAQIDERDGKLAAQSERFITVPYPGDLRQRVLNCKSVEEVCRLNVELGECFAAAAKTLCDEAGVSLNEVDAIGSHGQTVCHLPDLAGRSACPSKEARSNVGQTFLSANSTLQIGEPCVIAERTGVTTVADFRTRDVAAGGSGAPLVPMIDHLLLADPTVNRVALNIGGIANITVLPARGTLDDVVAFDTGPGNMIIDGVMSLLSGGRASYDPNGSIAAKGAVCDDLLDKLLADPYYAADPPKSTGREKFGADFVSNLVDWTRPIGLADADTVATATALTARTIADAIQRVSEQLETRNPKLETIVSGGGVHNATLMNTLREQLPDAQIVTSDAHGIDPDAKEALAFAALAWLTLNGRPGNVPRATGASRAVVLGKIIPGRRAFTTEKTGAV